MPCKFTCSQCGKEEAGFPMKEVTESGSTKVIYRVPSSWFQRVDGMTILEVCSKECIAGQNQKAGKEFPVVE